MAFKLLNDLKKNIKDSFPQTPSQAATRWMNDSNKALYNKTIEVLNNKFCNSYLEAFEIKKKHIWWRIKQRGIWTKV